MRAAKVAMLSAIRQVNETKVITFGNKINKGTERIYEVGSVK